MRGSFLTQQTVKAERVRDVCAGQEVPPSPPSGSDVSVAPKDNLHPGAVPWVS